MKPILHPDWKRISRRAWSMRLLAVAALLTGCEATLPYFAAEMSQRVFAATTFAVVVLAMVARVLAQGDL